MADTSTSLVVVKVSNTPEINQQSVQNHLDANFEGTRVAFDDKTLASTADIARLKKLYKIAPSQMTGQVKLNKDAKRAQAIVDDGSEVGRKELEVMVIGLMALRGAS